jgi:hypothetical protein
MDAAIVAAPHLVVCAILTEEFDWRLGAIHVLRSVR